MVDPSSGAEHAGVRNHLQATNLAIPSMPRCDQNPAGLSEDGSNIDTMSSKTTTVDSRLGDIDDEQIAGSVYSYHSARDIAQFVQENAGRSENFWLRSMRESSPAHAGCGTPSMTSTCFRRMKTNGLDCWSRNPWISVSKSVTIATGNTLPS